MEGGASSIHSPASGAGDRRSAAIIAPPEPRAPRDIKSPKQSLSANSPKNSTFAPKNLLKVLLDKGIFASINQALDSPTATSSPNPSMASSPSFLSKTK